MNQMSARPAIEAALRNPKLMAAAVALSENRLEDAEPILRAHLRDAPTDVAAIRMMAELAARDESSGRDEPTGLAPEKWPQQLTAACRQKAEAAGRSGDLRVVLDEAALTIGYAELECVVLELLVNALQSSRPGDTVQVCGRPAPGAYELRVCDEGVGLPRGGLEDPVSRPFGQTAPCGFGLAVVRFILRKNGATIEVDASRTEVTCLKVTLPLRGLRRSPTPAAPRSRALG